MIAEIHQVSSRNNVPEEKLKLSKMKWKLELQQ